MDLQRIAEIAARVCDEPGGNYVAPEIAITPEMAGLRMYEAPSLGVARPDDETFETLRRPDVVGPHFIAPAAWLPGARSVVSLFFPFTARVNVSNAALPHDPSAEWLHARIEGQAFIGSAMKRLKEELEAAGFATVVPALDPRFLAVEGVVGGDGRKIYTSNWSERHVAYACGLGTFGLSKGLITKRGVAGRYGSFVTALDLPTTPREYSGIYDWCSMCGKCARNCPADAISLETGKDHPPCAEFLNGMKVKYKPRYGCGKCQAGMPCQSGALKNPRA